jgi:chromatin assembly factor 1 subunit A
VILFLLFSELSNSVLLYRSHLFSWRNLGQSIRANRKQRWGLRQTPRTGIFNELKLTATKPAVHDDMLGLDKSVDRLEECSSDISSSPMSADTSPLDAKKYSRGRQLLQFDNAHRPAFYGIWSTKRLDYDYEWISNLTFNGLCPPMLLNS